MKTINLKFNNYFWEQLQLVSESFGKTPSEFTESLFDERCNAPDSKGIPSHFAKPRSLPQKVQCTHRT